jgi:hypothetical protein
MNRRDKPNDDRIYSPEEREFMQAIEAYKRGNNRPFPTWSEVLAVALALGYRKQVESREAMKPCPRCGSAMPRG